MAEAKSQNSICIQSEVFSVLKFLECLKKSKSLVVIFIMNIIGSLVST